MEESLPAFIGAKRLERKNNGFLLCSWARREWLLMKEILHDFLYQNRRSSGSIVCKVMQDVYIYINITNSRGNFKLEDRQAAWKLQAGLTTFALE